MKETELKVRIYGDKTLRKRSHLVIYVGEAEREILNKMAQVMYAHKGIGLAASQIGINKQLIVIDIGKGLIKLINPKIKQKKGCSFMQEGCLSVPDVSVNVKRAKCVFVEGIDEFNKKVCFWAEDLFSRVIQHEIDHLRGKLIIDYLSLLKKLNIRKKLKRSHDLGERSKTKSSG